MITRVALVPAAPWLLPGYAGLADPAPQVRSAAREVVASLYAACSRVVVLAATDREPRSTRPPIGRRVAEQLLADVRSGLRADVRAEVLARPRSGASAEANAAAAAVADGVVEVEVEVEVVEVPWDASTDVCVRLGRDLAARWAERAEGDGAGTVANSGVGDGTSGGAEASGGANSGAGGLAEGEHVGLLVVADGTATRTEKAPGHLDGRAAAFDDALVAALSDRLDPNALLRLDSTLAADLLCLGRAPLQVLAGALEARHTAYGQRRLEVSDPFGVLYVVGEWSATDTATDTATDATDGRREA